jgi:hypothetical protein
MIALLFEGMTFNKSNKLETTAIINILTFSGKKTKQLNFVGSQFRIFHRNRSEALHAKHDGHVIGEAP